MPKAVQTHLPDPTDERRQAWAEFKAGWKRSRKGNLWRQYNGMTLTIFGRDDGRFSWCVSDSDGPQFYRGTLESEEEAMLSVADMLEVGL